MSYIGNEPIVSATRTITEISATAGQTVFVPNGGYTVGFIDVFVNGAQLQTSDFTATNGTSVTLLAPAAVGDDVRLVAWGNFSVANIPSGALTAGAPLWSPTGGVTLPRIDSSNEGGQLNLNRSSDNTNAWSFDVYGSGSTPALRVLDTVNGAEVMRWNQSGSLILKGASTSANGTGIAFPGAQSASTDANTLDDYEEGTWTPVITGSGSNPTVSYSNQQGRYTKIGNVINFNLWIQLSSASGGSGALKLSLPFAVQSGSFHYYSTSLWFQNMTFSNVFAQGLCVNGEANMWITTMVNSKTSGYGNVLVTDLGNGAEIRICGTYFI